MVPKEMRCCSTCNDTLSVIAFDGDQKTCRRCRSGRTTKRQCNRPAAVKRKAELDKLRELPCLKCGYTGPAINFIQDPDKPRRTLDISQAALKSTRLFEEAIERSLRLCANCCIEVRGRVGKKRKPHVETFVATTELDKLFPTVRVDASRFHDL